MLKKKKIFWRLDSMKLAVESQLEFQTLHFDHLTKVTIQWRNSYGLRVGKPAGTQAEGAPAGCPFTLVFKLRLPFQKGAPFQQFLVPL